MCQGLRNHSPMDEPRAGGSLTGGSPSAGRTQVAVVGWTTHPASWLKPLLQVLTALMGLGVDSRGRAGSRGR